MKTTFLLRPDVRSGRTTVFWHTGCCGVAHAHMDNSLVADFVKGLADNKGVPAAVESPYYWMPGEEGYERVALCMLSRG